MTVWDLRHAIESRIPVEAVAIPAACVLVVAIVALVWLRIDARRTQAAPPVQRHPEDGPARSPWLAEPEDLVPPDVHRHWPRIPRRAWCQQCGHSAHRYRSCRERVTGGICGCPNRPGDLPAPDEIVEDPR